MVSIAFANTGFVLLRTIPSKLLSPGDDDLVEMFEDYLSRFACQTRRAVVFKILRDVEAVRIDSILAFRISLHRVYVHLLIALVRIEMEPPSRT